MNCKFIERWNGRIRINLRIYEARDNATTGPINNCTRTRCLQSVTRTCLKQPWKGCQSLAIEAPNVLDCIIVILCVLGLLALMIRQANVLGLCTFGARGLELFTIGYDDENLGDASG